MATRLENTLYKIKNAGHKALNIYITAGAPDIETSKLAIIEAAKAGADIIEIGMPFSDPLADGVVIQASSVQALKNKMTMRGILNMIRDLRRVMDRPLICMGYVNNLMSFGYRFGIEYNGFERFVTEGKIAGMDGLIVPDVPHEESEQMRAISKRKNVHLIEFITPLTTEERMKATCSEANGFVYCVSNTGVTGVKELNYEQIGEVISLARNYTKVPMMVGFGIGNPEAAVQAAKYSDGVIIGSAVVKRLMDGKFDEAMELIKSVRTALDDTYHK